MDSGAVGVHVVCTHSKILLSDANRPSLVCFFEHCPPLSQPYCMRSGKIHGPTGGPHVKRPVQHHLSALLSDRQGDRQRDRLERYSRELLTHRE